MARFNCGHQSRLWASWPRKKQCLKTLERWVIFPNRFTQLATICGDLHADIHDNIEEVKRSKPMSGSTQAHFAILKDISKRATNSYRKCTELSLMTPILAEAFINMIVIILCKREIRDNERQFEAFIRSHIDTKIFDLAYKCNGFAKPIEPDADEF
jgi:hypothetical protein